MYDRLRDLKMTRMNFKLPLPHDAQNVLVPINVPTYSSVQRDVEDSDSGQMLTAVDFGIIYEWASKESRTTGYSKIYLLAGYLMHYHEKVGELGERVQPLPSTLHLLVEYSTGNSMLHEITIDKDKGANFLRELYDITKAYDDDLSMAMETQLCQLKPEGLNMSDKWDSSEDLPSLAPKLNQLPQRADLIKRADGSYVDAEWLSANHMKLELENQQLRQDYEEVEKDFEKFKFMMDEYAKGLAPTRRQELLIEALEGIAKGKNPGTAFMTICMQEITNRIESSATTDEIYESLMGAAHQMDEAANVWSSMARALRAMIPDAEKVEAPAKAKDFKDIPEFISSCVSHKAYKGPGSLVIYVFGKELSDWRGKFQWELRPEALGFDSNEARAYLMTTLGNAKLLTKEGCYNLVARDTTSEGAPTIAACTIWF